jgi:hypothetical protein
MPLLRKHYDILLKICTDSAASGSAVDASNLFLDLFFDVISELTFGKSFNTLTEKHRNPAIADYLEGQKVMGIMLQNMWLLQLAKSLPSAQTARKKWKSRYGKALEERKQVVTGKAWFIVLC